MSIKTNTWIGRHEILLLFVSVGFLASCMSTQERVIIPRDSNEPSAVPVAEEANAASTCMQIVRIEVWKDKHTLRAYCKHGAVVAMDVALGRQEVGRKIRSGDQRTPEGRYRISGTARPGRFHLFIPIDYPSEEDARIAYAAGRISVADYERIKLALADGLAPPSDTELGGDLGLHGEGERWKGSSSHHDWTYGCIAVSDEQIEFLAQRIEAGVPVWIHP